jgi:hypothetical protein
LEHNNLETEDSSVELFPTQTHQSLTMTAQTIKPYLLHPQEWKLGVFLLLLLGGAYLHVQTSFPDGTTQYSGWFRLARSTTDVRAALTYNYCAADLNLMCPRPEDTERSVCARYFADTPLWNTLDLVQYHDSEMCTLETLARSAPSLPFTEADKAKFKDDETRMLMRLMARSLSLMWYNMGRYNFDGSLEEQEEKYRIIRWILSNVVDFFASDGADHESKAMGRGVTTRAWTRDELKELYRRTVQLASADSVGDKPIYKFILRVSEAIEELETLTSSSWAGHTPNISTGSLEIRTHTDIKQAYHIFYQEYQEICLYPHYAAGTLITNNCAQAMEAAPAKLRELEMEEEGFAAFTHTFSFGGNYLCFLLLIAFFSQRQRMEKRVEKGRRRLEQELNDPLLRRVLEKRAAAVLPEEQIAGFVSKLDNKAAALDSRGAALKLVRRQVRKFRFFVLFNLLLTTLVDVFLWAFHVTSIARYLETTILSILVLTASYAVPLAEDPKALGKSTGASDVLSQQDHIPATQPLIARV